MYKIPPQIDLIRPADYDPDDRPMIVPDSALRQFIYGPEKAKDLHRMQSGRNLPAPPPEQPPIRRLLR